MPPRTQEGGRHPEFLPLLYPMASQLALHWRKEKMGPFASGQAETGWKEPCLPGVPGWLRARPGASPGNPAVGVVSTCGGPQGRVWVAGQVGGKALGFRLTQPPPPPPSHLAQAPQAPAWRHLHSMAFWALTTTFNPVQGLGGQTPNQTDWVQTPALPPPG